MTKRRNRADITLAPGDIKAAQILQEMFALSSLTQAVRFALNATVSNQEKTQ